MQQTDKYKLNLIDRNDTFSPAPLNENAQKLEAAIAAEVATRAAETAAETAARAAADAALDLRLKAFESRRLAIGLYKPTRGITVDVGFRPKLVVILAAGNDLYSGVIFPEEYGVEPKQYGAITDTGFCIQSIHDSIVINNPSCAQYVYFAFG